MASHSGINWTDSSFAPWRGCSNVSPACERCYAQAIDKRAGLAAAWGPSGTRQRTSADYWLQPLRWQQQAARTGVRRRVFASHLSDIFDNKAPYQWLAEFWQLVRETPDLIWMILTKRTSRITRSLPMWWGDGPENVWLGCTVENMEEARRRIPMLLSVPAKLYWLSCEPVLEQLDLREFLPRLHLCVVGGESGAGARPFMPEWARGLRDQCRDAGAALWMKQTGSCRVTWPYVRGHGDQLSDLPCDLQIRELPR
jgi:protein gp37